MPTSSVTTAQTFKSNFYTAAVALLADQEVLVSFGHPGMEEQNWDDLVGFADLEVAQDVATMGTNRSREETLRLTVWISVHRDGEGPTLEQVTSDRAYALLGVLEHHVRQTDTTLGGAVRECFLTAHTSTGQTDPDLLTAGRTIEIEATFTARARVTGP